MKQCWRHDSRHFLASSRPSCFQPSWNLFSASNKTRFIRSFVAQLLTHVDPPRFLSIVKEQHFLGTQTAPSQFFMLFRETFYHMKKKKKKNLRFERTAGNVSKSRSQQQQDDVFLFPSLKENAMVQVTIGKNEICTKTLITVSFVFCESRGDIFLRLTVRNGFRNEIKLSARFVIAQVSFSSVALWRVVVVGREKVPKNKTRKWHCLSVTVISLIVLIVFRETMELLSSIRTWTSV